MRTYKYVSMQAGQTGKQLSTQARQARKYVCQSREHVNTQTSHLADFLFFQNTYRWLLLTFFICPRLFSKGNVNNVHYQWEVSLLANKFDFKKGKMKTKLLAK